MDFEIPARWRSCGRRSAPSSRSACCPTRGNGCAGKRRTSPPASRTRPPCGPCRRRRGPWGCGRATCPREAGGMGLRVVEYGLLNEVIGRAYFGPRIFGSNAPDSGNAELLWHSGTPAQKERFFWPLQRAEVRSFFGMTEPEVSGSDPTDLRTTAVRDGGRLGDRRAQVVQLERQRRRLRHRDGGDRGGRAAPRALHPDPGARGRAGAYAWCGPLSVHGPSQRAPATGRCASRAAACRSRTRSGSPARASPSPRPGSGPGASTTACAGSARPSAPSTSCAPTRRRARPSGARSRRSRPCRTGSRRARPRSRRPGS